MDIGVYTFGDLPTGARGAAAARQRLHELVAAARLADEAGLDVFGGGEHHRSDYAVSAPSVVLGALATATRRIRLSSAVSILSSADPVRLFEDFATLDLLSDGRAELMAGRGAFVESFPLFGFALDDYESLFTEKLDLLLRLNAEPRIRWRGQHRPARDRQPARLRPSSALASRSAPLSPAQPSLKLRFMVQEPRSKSLPLRSSMFLFGASPLR